MIVAFTHFGTDDRFVKIMLASIRRVMPHALTLQMTDEHTAALADVDEVRRLPYDGEFLMTYRLRHMAELSYGEYLFLDTDVVVLQDVSGIFDLPFDVALPRCERPVLAPDGTDISQTMPYNFGVLFSRSPLFWEQAHEVCKTFTPDVQKCWGDQLAVKLVVDTDEFDVLELPGDTFNFTPDNAQEDLGPRAIVHYKGKRKHWMLERFPV